MTTYISLETAFHALAVTYMLPLLLLILASAVGLALIETIEEVGEL